VTLKSSGLGSRIRRDRDGATPVGGWLSLGRVSGPLTEALVKNMIARVAMFVRQRIIIGIEGSRKFRKDHCGISVVSCHELLEPSLDLRSSLDSSPSVSFSIESLIASLISADRL
jgi:hypothetical protein